MRIKIISALVLSFFFLPRKENFSAAADISKKTAASGFWANRYDEIKSPLTTPARPWLIYGSAATLTLVVFEDLIVDPTQQDTVEDKPLGRTSVYGDYVGQMIPNALYAIGMGLHYWIVKNKKSADASIAMLKATAYSGAVTQSLKYIVHEPRPNNTSDHRSYESFPSGHTTTAFAFSSTVIAQHGFWPYGFMATVLASFSGFSRMNDNKHYIHDVAGGFTIGSAYGFGISYLQQGKQITKTETVATRWGIYPSYSENLKGLIAFYEF